MIYLDVHLYLWYNKFKKRQYFIQHNYVQLLIRLIVNCFISLNFNWLFFMKPSRYIFSELSAEALFNTRNGLKKRFFPEML